MRILIALLPAFFWGIMPLFLNWAGGKPIEQMLGSVYGSALTGILVYIVLHPDISMDTFLWCLFAGMCWPVGCITQYNAYTKVGVSITMTASTGAQLVGTSLLGVLFFGSWLTGFDKLAGFSAILIIIIGVCMSAVHDHSGSAKISSANFKAGMINCILGSVGFILCNSLPKIPSVSGYKMILPQTLGMLISGSIIALSFHQYRKIRPFFKKVTFKNISTGISFGIAECSYFLSININGLSTGCVLSQMCVVVSTLVGLFIIKEHKTRKELYLTLAGMVLVVIGGAITGTV